MIRKNIRLLNKDLQALFQFIESNKKFKVKNIYIKSYKTINMVFKNNLSIKIHREKIIFYEFKSLIKSFKNNFMKYTYKRFFSIRFLLAYSFFFFKTYFKRAFYINIFKVHIFFFLFKKKNIKRIFLCNDKKLFLGLLRFYKFFCL